MRKMVFRDARRWHASVPVGTAGYGASAMLARHFSP
jgi:hypothetical protein